VFSPAKRSEVMAKIRSRGNRSTERRLRAQLASAGIGGWRMHASDLPGTPDFVFDSRRLVVFVDGCFWHGCQRCRTIPKSNREFWEEKIGGTIRRDRRVDGYLRSKGWSVLHVWEHDVKASPRGLHRVRRALARR